MNKLFISLSLILSVSAPIAASSIPARPASFSEKVSNFLQSLKVTRSGGIAGMGGSAANFGLHPVQTHSNPAPSTDYQIKMQKALDNLSAIAK